jgi:hypothetical protein
MLPNTPPKRKLEITIPLTRRPTESPEISPLGSPVKSEAASSDSTVKDGKRKDDGIGSGGTERDSTERGSAEGDRTQRDRHERDSTTSLSHLRLLHVDNPDTDSLACLGFSYVNRNVVETSRQNTKIKHWNCHTVSIFLCSTLISTFSTKFLTGLIKVLQNQRN